MCSLPAGGHSVSAAGGPSICFNYTGDEGKHLPQRVHPVNIPTINSGPGKIQGLKKPITRTEGKKLDGDYNIAENLADGGAEQGENDDNNNRDQNKNQCVFN
jgi:hypothetical protein